MEVLEKNLQLLFDFLRDRRWVKFTICGWSWPSANQARRNYVSSFSVGQVQKILAPLITHDSARATLHTSFLSCFYWLQRQSARSQSSLQGESRDRWCWKIIVNDRQWEKSCILNLAKDKWIWIWEKYSG